MKKKAAKKRIRGKAAKSKRARNKGPAWMGEPPAVRKTKRFKLSRDRICGCVAFLRRDHHSADHYEMTIGTPSQPVLARLALTENEHGWFVARCDRMPLPIQQAALSYIKTLPRRRKTA